MRQLLLFFLVLATGVVRSFEVWAQAPCVDTPNSGACFRAYDAATGQELPRQLCIGRPFRLRDCSGRALNPAQIYYQIGSATVCRGFQDTTTTFTLRAPGQVFITQNTQGSGTQGVIYSKEYTVREAPAPVFTVTACNPEQVQVTITDQRYDQYEVEVNGVRQLVAPNTPTTFFRGNATSVKVTGQYRAAGLCSNSATQTFTPLPAPPAQVPLQRISVQGTGVELQFGALQPEYTYSVQAQDAASPGGFRTLATVPTSATSFALPYSVLPGCFRLLLTDACQSSGFAIASPVVCSVSLTATASNGRNQLSWSTGATGSLALFRNGQLLQNLPAGSTQYEDADVVCGTVYRYRLVVSNPPVASESNEAEVTTTSTLPPPPPQLTASFNLRNQVELTARAAGSPTSGRLIYQRNGAQLTSIPAPAGLLRDSLVAPNPAAALCYTVRFEDACGNRSADSSPACPVVLAAAPANETGSEIRLTWTPLRGPDPAAPVAYQVLLLSATNAVLSRRPVTGLTYLDAPPPTSPQRVRYRIEATGAGLAAPSYSNVVEVIRTVRLFVPTAFTPNGDGLNDVLELKGRYLDNFQFVVMDRNGKEVFRATDRTRTWDGRIGSQAPVPGAYVWRFEATDQDGQRTVQHGTVTVLR